MPFSWPPRPEFLVEWLSTDNPADEPPTTLKNAGLTASRLPAALVNWLLVGLTAYIDGWLDAFVGRYRKVKFFDGWRLGHTWGGIYAKPIFLVTTTGAGLHVGYYRQDGQQAAEDTGFLFQVLDLPPGARTLEQVSVRIKPATGHTATPSTLPKIRVLVVDQDGAVTATFNAADTSAPASSAVGADITAYEAAHDIVCASMDQTIVPGQDKVLLYVFGEAGGGSTFQAGLEVRNAAAQYLWRVYEDAVWGDLDE